MSNDDLVPFLYVSESDLHGGSGDSREQLIGDSLEFLGEVASSVPALQVMGGLVGSAMIGAAFKGLAKSEETDSENEKFKNMPASKRIPSKAFNGSALTKRLANASGLNVTTLNDLKKCDYRFPPGHPVPGKLYRLHPLSKNPHLGKGNVFIPSWSYDEVLYAEREAELIRLLVCLGATRISIRKAGASSSASFNAVGGSVAVAGGMAAASGSVENEYASAKASSDVRTFILEGKPWRIGDKLDVEAFGWLPYEPSWGSIVQAREAGGCLQAMIELNSRSAFSSESLIEASLNYGLNHAEGMKQSKSSGSSDKSYIIEAEFGRREAIVSS